MPNAVYMPLHGFTAVDLGYQRGNAVSNIVNKFDEPANTSVFLSLFDQIWRDPDKLKDVTSLVCEHIASVYQENSPERIYFLMLYNIFNEFLEDLNEDTLPNDRTGYLDTLVWQKLFNFQRDAATGIINKLETFNGCILADSVGLGKTFTALAVIKYYELRNRSVLVLCPKKLADNWLTYNRNLKTNIFAKDRFNYDVLCHTDLQRTRGESFGMPLNRVNWGNYDLVVIDESHNFRNNDAYKDKETRYQKLMNSVIKQGVKTKVLMLSATPVNNRFNDLRNQLALAYEGNTGLLGDKLRTEKDIDEIFRRAQAAFNNWTKLPPDDRTASAILAALDFDFFELLDSVTIARSRKHIETFYDTKDIGNFPEPVLKTLIADNRIWFGADGNNVPAIKRFLTEVKQGTACQTIWKYSDVGHSQDAKKEVNDLFPESAVFDTPKPTRLIKRILQVATDKDDIALDFFSGSATTADAVMQINAEDGGTRKFILVQIPEVCDEKSEAAKAGYRTIAEISKERIRRAGKKIKAKNAGVAGISKVDFGFRALKIDSSNMKEVFYTPDAISQDLLSDQVNNIREDRTSEDLLFQVLLDWGVDLALPIAQESIAGKTVYFVDGNALAACFEVGVSEEFVKLLAKREPLRAVFRDSGFANDSVKINVEQIFKLMSPGTEVKCI